MKYNDLIKYFLLFIINILIAATSFGATIDLLIVYDTTAKTWVDSNGGMSVFSQQAVDKLNQAMTNSNISLTFRLAYTSNVSYTHSNFPTIQAGLSNDLDDLQAGTGGLATAHTWRNTYGADMVAMFVDTGQDYGYVGMGYELSNPSGSPNYAFNVDNIRNVLSGHTLTHELGHNFGAGHSKYQTQQTGPGIFSYSAGWYFNGTNSVAYHTIMAYDTDGYGISYTEAPLFSTPLLSHQGTVAGSATDGDNARTIRETMDVVAAYRTSSTPTCTYSISPTSNSFTSSSGAGSVNVTASSSSCSWTATSNATWITITTGSSGTGSGSVSYSVSQNTSASSRTGTITIAGNTFTLTQSGATPSCAYSISPTSNSFTSSSGSGSVSVTASSSSCSWTATSNATWITITAGSSRTGSGSVSYSVSQNTSSSSRTGTITIAEKTFTVTQSGAGSSCAYSISPTSNSFTSSSGAGSVSVTASSSSCSWTSTSNATWITVTAGSSGTGSGSVSYSVSQNTSSSSRTGTITIAGNTFTVTQSGTQSTSTLGEAVDNTSLTWTTGGNANWASQTTTYYNGGDAAKSGTITHNQSTWMQTTVTGPGVLTFYWKVSSEADSQYCYDWLSFYVDSTEMNWICGETNWAQKSFQISSGTHTLKWTYIKDQLNSSGSDAGWVDYVTWQPTTSPAGAARLIACDLNGDSKDDLLSIDTNGGMQYSTNLTNWVQIPGNLSVDVACGDLNGDGSADIAGIASNGQIWYTLNKGSNWNNISGALSRVFIADMNGDLKADILGLSPSGYIYITYDLTYWSNIPGVLIDIQPGNFNTSRAGNEFAGINTSGYVYYTTNLSSWYNVPGALAKLFAGDINSDGRSDLIGLNSANEIYYTTNLATWTNIPGGLVYITTGDFNGDGKNDIIGLNSTNYIYYTINLSTWINVPGQLTSLATGDFNGDGKDDVAGVGTDGKVYYTTNLTNWNGLDPYSF